MLGFKLINGLFTDPRWKEHGDRYYVRSHGSFSRAHGTSWRSVKKLPGFHYDHYDIEDWFELLKGVVALILCLGMIGIFICFFFWILVGTVWSVWKDVPRQSSSPPLAVIEKPAVASPNKLPVDARIVHYHYRMTAEEYRDFEYWRQLNAIDKMTAERIRQNREGDKK